jgi:hypothetical protein
MAINYVNLGNFSNDGTGDDLRTAFTKVNNNFTELDIALVSGGSNLGAGAPVFAGKVTSTEVGDNLSFRTLVAGANTSISYNASTITISSSNNVLTEINGDLDVKSFSIISTLNRNIRLTPDGTGKIVLDGLEWPSTYGIDGQVLTTDGSGQLSWSDGGGADWSFPDFNGVYTNPIQYLLDQQDINLGSFIPNTFDEPIQINLGTF